MFKPERGATDVSLQLDQIIQSPLTTALRWLTTLLSDSVDVVVLGLGATVIILIALDLVAQPAPFGIGVEFCFGCDPLFALKQLDGPNESEASSWRSRSFLGWCCRV